MGRKAFKKLLNQRNVGDRYWTSPKARADNAETRLGSHYTLPSCMMSRTAFNVPIEVHQRSKEGGFK